MSVIDWRARFSTVSVFFALDPAPLSVRHARLLKLSAERDRCSLALAPSCIEDRVLQQGQSPSLLYLASVLTGKAFCKRRKEFFLAASWEERLIFSYVRFWAA